MIDGEEYVEDEERAIIPKAVLKQIRVEDIPDNFEIEVCESKDSSVIMVSVPMTFVKVGKNEFQVICDELITRKYYSARELERQIDSGYYERLLLSSGKAPSALERREMSGVLRDMYMLEFLDLPEPYQEKDLKKAILKNLKKFLIEFGRDFLFIGQEYHLQVGTKDYFVDLLFFHRELQCLVAIDLKIDDFKPEYLGKMEFYLEALDRDEKKPHENPSVGIILCKNADSDVVEYALNRNMTSTMIAEYRTKLIDKEVLRRKLDQIFEEAEDGSDTAQNCE